MHKLSNEEFISTYSKVPRLCVEVVIIDKQKGLFLTKRNIEPSKGLWHSPGGTVYYDETLREAVVRIAKKELGVDVEVVKELGVMEIRFDNHFYHDVTIAYEVTVVCGSVALNDEAKEEGYFIVMPEDMIPEQKEFYKKTLNLGQK